MTNDPVPERCRVCNDERSEDFTLCWDIGDSFTGHPIVLCARWGRDLLRDIEAIKTVDDLRDCIVRYCEPNPAGGILHLVLEEGGYEDKTIHWELEYERTHPREDDDPLNLACGIALAQALLKFTPAEREWANRWESPNFISREAAIAEISSRLEALGSAEAWAQTPPEPSDAPLATFIRTTYEELTGTKCEVIESDGSTSVHRTFTIATPRATQIDLTVVPVSGARREQAS